MPQFYKSFLLPILLFMGFSHALLAQTKWVQGNVIIDNSDEIAEGVVVSNKRTNHSTKTNFAGIFFIQAQENDTLLIRSDWYENRNIILKPALFNKSEIVIHLSVKTIHLKEAIIAKKLTGVLEKDVTGGKKEDDLTRLYKILNVNPDINPIKDTAALKTGLFNGDIRLTGLDVGRLYDAFSGNLRKRKAAMEYETQNYNVAQIRSYFGDQYFQLELNIPKYKINEFIVTALSNTNNIHQLKQPNYFTIQEILKNYSKKYLDDLFKLRINKDYEDNRIKEQELYLNVPLDSIPKD